MVLDWPWARVHAEAAAAARLRADRQRVHYRMLALLTRLAQAETEEGGRAWQELYDSLADPEPVLPDAPSEDGLPPLGFPVTALQVAPNGTAP